MHFIHLAQEPTPVSDAAVVEVVEQATKAIDTFNNLGVFMAVVGVFAFFALAILILVWSNRNTSNTAVTTQAQVIADKARENQELKDERRAADLRQQQYQEQFLAMIAVISGKQVEGTAATIKSGVDSEARLSSQVTTAEGNIKGRVAAGADANMVAFEKVYRLLESAAKIALSRPPDPLAAQKYDRALEILTAQVEAVEADVAGVKADTAANTDARVNTAEMLAVVPPADLGAAATAGDGELGIAS